MKSIFLSVSEVFSTWSRLCHCICHLVGQAMSLIKWVKGGSLTVFSKWWMLEALYCKWPLLARTVEEKFNKKLVLWTAFQWEQ